MGVGSGRVQADEPAAEVLHEPHEPPRDAVAAELAIAGQPGVGPHGAEQPRPAGGEAGVDHERLDAGDLHESSGGRL